MTYPWKTSKRYNAYADHIRSLFGERVQKVAVDAGFTCPNRDGSISSGGCSFCSNDAFNPSYCSPEKPVAVQIQEGISFHRHRYRRASRYFAYFQAYSNTYGTLGYIRKLYEEALAVEGVVGIVIGTRPDCLYEGLVNYLVDLSRFHYVLVEIGIESCYDDTLLRINRGHTFRQSQEAIRMLAGRGIRTGAHLILGLPGESREAMLQEAGLLSELPLDVLKIHQLQIVKGTTLASQYAKNPDGFSLQGLDDYIDLVVDFTERLNPAIMIERFASEVPPKHLIAPDWGMIRYDEVLRLITQRFEERKTWQGREYAV